ncbi:hypothetical protein CPB85DRAFT_1438579 [Mucidula mucida]|nr:hypothetical protein CPB85DRAFT_1438579 [Mucidula mucida]
MNRYLPFVDTMMQMDLEFRSDNTLQKCWVNNIIITWLIVVGVWISEMILTLRTYAFWQGDKRVLALFLFLIVALGVPGITFVQIQLSSIRYEIDDFGGCVTAYANPIAIGTYILLVVYETFIAILSLVKAAQQRTTSSWVVRLYTESFIFYVYILVSPFFSFRGNRLNHIVVSLINLIMPIAKPSLAQRFAGPLRVLHSIFCNRILFTIVGHRPVGSARSATPVLSSVVTDPQFSTDLATIELEAADSFVPRPQR